MIFIPSRSRPRVTTLRELRRHGYTGPVTVVVPESQKSSYSVDAELVGLPDSYHIAETRQAIVDMSRSNYVIMMDDDLRFFERVSIDDHSLQNKNVDANAIVAWLFDKLGEYAHASISTREQNFQQTRKLLKHRSLELELERPYRVYALRRDVLRDLNLGFGDAGNTMDDFEVTLSLIEHGYKNIVNFMYCHNQDISNAPGGASDYRDLAVLEESAKALYKRHPEYVKLVQKTTIDSWGGSAEKPVTRTDVIIQWKKALGAKIV